MPDARVEAAVANWAPRFVAQGVDFNDFRRTTAGIETWADSYGPVNSGNTTGPRSPSTS